MSCEECEGEGAGEYPYRWGATNILIVACEKHVMEVFQALNWAQDHP